MRESRKDIDSKLLPDDIRSVVSDDLKLREQLQEQVSSIWQQINEVDSRLSRRLFNICTERGMLANFKWNTLIGHDSVKLEADISDKGDGNVKTIADMFWDGYQNRYCFGPVEMDLDGNRMTLRFPDVSTLVDFATKYQLPVSTGWIQESIDSNVRHAQRYIDEAKEAEATRNVLVASLKQFGLIWANRDSTQQGSEGEVFSRGTTADQ
jgi:hypothetical protein